MLDGFCERAMGARTMRGAVLACLMALSACGGGGEQQAGVSSGGTGSFSSGPVTAKGSIVVTGVHFDHGTATVTDADGVTVPSQDLDLGMMVEVEGGDVFVVAEGESARGKAIRVTSELIGPVTAVESGRLWVMGQRVRVTPQTFVRTKVNGTWQNMPIGQIGLDDIVEVHGFQDVSEDPTVTTFIATRIEKKDRDSVAHYVVRGVVHDLSDTGCKIGSQRMDFAWAGKPGVRNGVVARAQLYKDDYAGAGMNWRAVDVRLSTPLVADHRNVRLEGLVTEWASPTAFSVNGVVVDGRRAPCARCVLGAPVTVRGEMVKSVLKAESAQEMPAP